MSDIKIKPKNILKNLYFIFLNLFSSIVTWFSLSSLFGVLSIVPFVALFFRKKTRIINLSLLLFSLIYSLLIAYPQIYTRMDSYSAGLKYSSQAQELSRVLGYGFISTSAIASGYPILGITSGVIAFTPVPLINEIMPRLLEAGFVTLEKHKEVFIAQLGGTFLGFVLGIFCGLFVYFGLGLRSVPISFTFIGFGWLFGGALGTEIALKIDDSADEKIINAIFFSGTSFLLYYFVLIFVNEKIKIWDKLLVFLSKDEK
ncbi:MAG: hypothetical protein ACK58N_08760 [Synechocystis sp.]|jgi:hypothetical protein